MSDPLYYVVDEVVVLRAVRQLTELIFSKPELRWAALIDGAFDVLDGNNTSYAQSGINCFQFNEFEGLAGAAPWLVPLAGDQSLHTQLQTLIRHCQGRPMLSFLAIPGELEDLCEDWRPLHFAKVIDDQRMLLRFSDTRVLSLLPTILSDSQWLAIRRDTECWMYFDREGRLVDCVKAVESQQVVTELLISKDQLDMLLDAAHPDAMMATILEFMPDVIPVDCKMSTLYSYVLQSSILAKKFAVENEADIFSLVIAACMTSGLSNSDPLTATFLEAKAWNSGQLGEALVDRGLL